METVQNVAESCRVLSCLGSCLVVTILSYQKEGQILSDGARPGLLGALVDDRWNGMGPHRQYSGIRMETTQMGNKQTMAGSGVVGLVMGMMMVAAAAAVFVLRTPSGPSILAIVLVDRGGHEHLGRAWNVREESCEDVGTSLL